MEESVVDLTLLVRQKRPLRLIWSSPRLSCAASLYLCKWVRFSLPIPLPPSPDPPEALGELLNIEIAIPWKLCNGRAPGGVEIGMRLQALFSGLTAASSGNTLTVKHIRATVGVYVQNVGIFHLLSAPTDGTPMDADKR